MERRSKNARKLNCSLTESVIELHHKGYINDFLKVKDQCFRCIQSDEEFSIGELQIKIVSQGFDYFTKNYKYIHTVESQNGCKGLLLADFICSNVRSFFTGL